MCLRKYILIFSLFILTAPVSAQIDENSLKLSGIVMMLDSMKPVPYTHIYINRTNIGVRANDMGLFSIMVHIHDTLIFSAIGVKSTSYIVPDSLTEKSYSIIQRMPRDTITLKTFELSSWPTLDQFNAAFTKEFGFNKKYAQGQKNANPSQSAIRLDVPKMDAMDNYELEGMRYGNRYSYIYENAHIPAEKLLNPLNWDDLVEQWKKGSREIR